MLLGKYLIIACIEKCLNHKMDGYVFQSLASFEELDL